MLGDGDTTMIAKVNNAEPYGAGVVKKEECIGHVAKSFYKRLERVCCKRVKNPRGVVATIKGASGLSKENLARVCRYYRGAILSNTDNVDGMIRDIQAVFHHCSSTDENRSIHFVQKGSIPGANSTNTSKKKQKIQTQTCLCLNTGSP